ncbi:hypothetical protein Tco_1371299 [Tanacetum coccineum]
MADNRTMAQMLQAPIEGYEDAIVVPPINANNFELKQPLINLVQSNKFTGRQDPHNHLRFFNKVTSTFRHPEVPNTSIKLLLFPFSLDGEARDWQLRKPPDQFSHGMPCFIVLKSILPPSKTTYLWNEITTFFPKPRTFMKGNGSWEAINRSISKSKVRYSRSRPNDSRAITNAPSSTSSPSNNSFEVQQMAALLEDKMNIRMSRLEKAISEKNATTPATIKAVEESKPSKQSRSSFSTTNQSTTGLPSSNISSSYASNSRCSKKIFETTVKANDAVLKNVQNQGQNLQNQMANVTSLLTNFCDNFKNSTSTSNSGTLPSQTVTNPRQQINAITTRSGKTLEEPSTPLVPTPDVSNPQKEPEQNPETSTENALVEMPKFNKWLSSLLRNKEKLEEISIKTVNAECSAIIMNKVPGKLEDQGKFLIPCALQELNRTSSLADSGASINLLYLFICKKLGLEALTFY